MHRRSSPCMVMLRRSRRVRRDVADRPRLGRAARFSIAESIHVHDLTAESEQDFRMPERSRQRRDFAHCLARRCCARASRSARSMIRRTEVRPFTEKQITAAAKPSPTKRSSPSRMCGCSRNCRSATRNCARRWSSRPQRPRCSASSARSPTDVQPVLMPSVESAAGFVGD